MMKLRIIFIFVWLICGFSLTMFAQKVERVEPLCWWAEMKTDLQLMLYGQNLKGANVKVLQQGMTVKAVHNAESPDYLFIDMDVEKAGRYTIEITRGLKKTSVDYEILSRRPGSESRIGLTLSDVIYLIMPDRFSNGDPDNDVVKGSTQVLDRKGLETRHGGDIQGIINHLDYIADLGVTTL